MSLLAMSDIDSSGEEEREIMSNHFTSEQKRIVRAAIAYIKTNPEDDAGPWCDAYDELFNAVQALEYDQYYPECGCSRTEGHSKDCPTQG